MVYLEKYPDKLTGVLCRRLKEVSVTMLSLSFLLLCYGNTGLGSSVSDSEDGIRDTKCFFSDSVRV